MPYELKIRPLASGEIIEAYDWYEQQREGLGMEFLNELNNFYNSLLENPYTHSYYEKPVREGKINRFPYLVIYEVFDDSEIIIYSVFMSKKDPSKKRTS